MTDYGHELEFGTFLTPSNARPDAVVALSQASEAAGLDLLTFQDHPYQPGFLDTWTLISYVAAQTTSIHLSANVTNLPLRQPAVLARSVASLDLLTRGRVELGLGAGAFWDAIEAMGGRRLTPGQGVRALEEAIAIIRGIWDAGNPDILHVDGEHYRVHGAKRGPAPAHDVGIWLGAYKPKMLALTGRVADGWLPSLGYLEAGDLETGNRLVDEAASDAGRDPIDVRRLLNVNGRFSARGAGLLHGPVGQWVEELADLALTHGTSTFILGTDDPADIQRFGLEVAPAVRERVEQARAGRPGIDADPAPQPPEPSPERIDVTPHDGRLPGVQATPDDGVRLSAEQPWDESTRPKAPTPQPGLIYSDQGRAIAQHLVDVHDGLRTELAQVQDIIDQVKAGSLDVGAARSGINEMTMRQNNWTMGAYCASYCRVVTQHHSLEDQGIFPHLRSADHDLAPVIDRLAEEHHVIHEVLEGVDAALVAHVASPEDFTGLDAAVDLLRDTLLSHLSYEERELVEPLARHGMYAGQF